MKITELVLGVVGPEGPKAHHFRGEELSRVVFAGASEVAQAVRETIAASERTVLKDRVPFIRVTAVSGELTLEIADDASARLRMLTETRGEEMPLILEAKHGDEARIDALLEKIALAAGAEDSAVLLAALETAESGETTRKGDETAYLAAQRRATQLQKEVKAIDDRMTKSVVPDWIWIATAFGGAGVLMTVVALLYPELRVHVLPVMLSISVVAFGLYGLMSWRELKKRSALMAERKELRARRERARAEARALAGTDHTSALDVPALVTTPPASPTSRQVIVFAEP